MKDNSHDPHTNFMVSFLQRLKQAKGRLSKSPAFLYETNEEFLRAQNVSEWPEYRLWLSKNRLFTKEGLQHLHDETKRFKLKPLISVIMPVYNPDPFEFQKAVESLLWQAYPHWQLCIADDRSSNRDYLKILGRIRDRRIKVCVNPAHAGIAGSSQHALEMADGDFVALMDQDDELYPDALFSFVQALQTQTIDYFYSDRDMISPTGERYMHFMKPGWSPEYLLSFNYVCHFEIYRKNLAIDIGGFRRAYEGSQDYDLVLRATERTDNVYHHPMVLYSWRQSRNSVATNLETKSYAFDAGAQAVKVAARRRGLPVRDATEDKELWRGHFRLIWDDGLLADRKISFLAIGNHSTGTERAIALLNRCTGPFKNCEFFSARPCSVEISQLLSTLRPDGYVFFCDSTVTDIVTASLLDMVGYLAIPGVNVVGCKFLDKNNKISNVGLSVAASGKILFAYRGNPAEDFGYGAVTAVPRNVSLLYPAFWGATVEDLKQKWCAGPQSSYGDAALHYFKETIKLGGRLVCVPSMCLELDTTELDYKDEMKRFLAEWQGEGLNDPYYNPNLTDRYEDFGLKV